MRKKAKLLTSLSAFLLLPAALMLQGCISSFPSIMNPPQGGDNSPTIPSPAMPSPSTGGGGETGEDSGGGGGGGKTSPMPSLPGGGLPIPGGSMPDMPGAPNMPGGGDSAGGDGDSDDGGWETSNELPDPLQVPGQGSGSGSGESEEEGAAGDGECDDGSDDPFSKSRPGEEGQADCTTEGSGEESDGDPMEDALGDLDGGILDKRNEARDRDNTDASGQGIPGENDGGLEPSQGTTMGKQEDSAAEDSKPIPAPSSEGIAKPKSAPDARDDDIIARQLREAAEAETDPELQQDLWEEYERYKSRR